MKQSQLDRAVAQATGETRDTIRYRGFTLLEFSETTEDDAPCIVGNAPECSTRSDTDGQHNEIDAHQFPSRRP